MNFSFSRMDWLLFLALAVVGTTTIVGGTDITQAWADVIEGTEGLDFIEGTPEADFIDSKGGDDSSTGDTFSGDGSGNDVIVSGEGDDSNFGDAVPAFGGTGSGDDVIISGEDDDSNTGNEGRDIFVCGGGEQDTVTDYNEAEGDIAAPDCENV
jgi:Ca2+-binding RTX toxin-like protein